MSKSSKPLSSNNRRKMINYLWQGLDATFAITQSVQYLVILDLLLHNFKEVEFCGFPIKVI